MRLQLTDSQAEDAAREIGEYTTLSQVVARIFREFRRQGHVKITRKDVQAVLDRVPGQPEEWLDIGPMLRALPSVPNERGFYSLENIPNTPDEDDDMTESAATAEDGEPTIDESQFTIEVKKATGVSWTPVAPELDRAATLYAEDIGLRRIAVADSKCFARSYNPASPACGACALACFCAEASKSNMAVVAARLDRQTEANIARAEQEAQRAMLEAKRNAERRAQSEQYPSPPTGTGTGVSPKPGAFKLQPGDRVSRIKVPFRGVCSHCDGEVRQHSEAIHVVSGGMFHLECIDLCGQEV